MRPLALLALVTLATGASAQERVKPARGVFLVAEPEIEGGPFHQSVVLLLSHGEDGTLGLIVNRATRMPLSEALPELDVGEPPPRLFFGGPVGLEGLLVLFRSDVPPDNVDPVMENVYYSGDRTVLEELIKGGKPSEELRLFIGHSGWAPGQLDAELLRGTWDVRRADASTVFHTEPGRMWEDLSMSGRTYARSSRSSHHSPPSELQMTRGSIIAAAPGASWPRQAAIPEPLER
jgi:putative transcriptional regulator